VSPRVVGFGLTVAAVVVLLVSTIAGIDPNAPRADYEVLVVPGIPRVDDRVRVEVLNGAGVNGLARAVTERLRGDGFDVVYYGNAGSLARDSTTILDRSGNEAAIAALSSALGVNRVETAIDTSLYLEATVVLGGDWRQEGIGNRE
jgi:LytR cell envelope-related transcriptional attenuator